MESNRKTRAKAAGKPKDVRGKATAGARGAAKGRGKASVAKSAGGSKGSTGSRATGAKAGSPASKSGSVKTNGNKSTGTKASGNKAAGTKGSGTRVAASDSGTKKSHSPAPTSLPSSKQSAVKQNTKPSPVEAKQSLSVKAVSSSSLNRNHVSVTAPKENAVAPPKPEVKAFVPTIPPPVLNAEFVSRAVGTANLEADAAKTLFSGVSIDSRSIKPKTLFIAIKGISFDGHDFIEDAIQKGATGVVCSRLPEGFSKPSGVVILKVDDTQMAFSKLAGAWRNGYQIPIVAVAGSVGKTTTKDFLAAVLSGKFSKILKTQGSENGFVGIPKTLIELKPDHDIAVVEIGIDNVGAMKKHAELVRPQIGIVTAIAAEHLENLKNLETVANEEFKLTEFLIENQGIPVFNGDEELSRLRFAATKYDKKLSFTLSSPFKVRPDTVAGRVSLDGLILEVSSEVGGVKLHRESYVLPLLGKHNASNLLGAITVGYGLGMSPDEVRAGLKNFVGSPGRSQIESLPRGELIICDYYNASPASMSAALDLLAERVRTMKRKGTTWACLGDMLELGKDEEAMHRRLAEKLAASNVGYAYLIGERMKWLADELERRRFDISVKHFSSHEALAAELRLWMRPTDAILIKGSRGMTMEKVWIALQAACAR